MNSPIPPPVADSVEFAKGQVVPLPRAPDGFGQVDDLLRTNVVVRYCRRGREHTVKVNAFKLAELCATRPLLPLLAHNPLERGVRPRTKRFVRKTA